MGIEEARHYFARVGADLIGHFSRFGSKCTELDAEEKLRIFHDFYRTGEETAFRLDMVQSMKKGHDFKDYICPDTFEFEKDCFRIGNRYGRVIFLREYAAYIKDSMVAELCELNRNMMLSVDVVPVPTDEAVREVENRLLGVETNITNWQRKLTLEQKIAHGGHPVLRWMMDNIFIRTDPAGNIKADKEKSTEKIDGAVATIMGLDRAIRCGINTGTSVYDERGILFI